MIVFDKVPAPDRPKPAIDILAARRRARAETGSPTAVALADEKNLWREARRLRWRIVADVAQVIAGAVVLMTLVVLLARAFVLDP